MGKNIVIFSGDFPYPPNHGGRVDIYERIITLKKMGFDITLIATIKKQENRKNISHMEKFCKNIFLINRKNSIFDLFSFLPYQVKSRLNVLELDKLSKLIKNLSFDYTILEGHYLISLYQYLEGSFDNGVVYLRVQNNETIYFRQLAKSTRTLFKKIFYRLESIKFNLYESKVFKENIFSKCLHISFDEYIDYGKKYPNVEHIFLPASLNTDEMLDYSENNSCTVLFIGSLFMSNNMEGLRWYLENIHEEMVDSFPKYKFIIAGNTKGIKVKKLLDYLSSYSNIEFFDSPADLSFLYDKSEIFINPMLSGAGVKLKTINAIKYGMPVVSTNIGNEGTGLISNTHIMVESNVQNFKEAIIYLLNDNEIKRDLVANAQQYLLKKYNQMENLNFILLERKNENSNSDRLA